jgi:hypothetical protein
LNNVTDTVTIESSREHDIEDLAIINRSRTNTPDAGTTTTELCAPILASTSAAQDTNPDYAQAEPGGELSDFTMPIPVVERSMSPRITQMCVEIQDLTSETDQYSHDNAARESGGTERYDYHSNLVKKAIHDAQLAAEMDDDWFAPIDENRRGVGLPLEVGTGMLSSDTSTDINNETDQCSYDPMQHNRDQQLTTEATPELDIHRVDRGEQNSASNLRTESELNIYVTDNVILDRTRENDTEDLVIVNSRLSTDTPDAGTTTEPHAPILVSTSAAFVPDQRQDNHSDIARPKPGEELGDFTMTMPVVDK